jgi:hypothetical protein
VTGGRKGFANLCNKLKNIPSVGYFTEYPTPADFDQKSASDLRIPSGLVAWHKVEDSVGGSRVLCYWTSRDSFMRDRGEWEANFAGAHNPTYMGLVGPVNGFKESLWTRGISIRDLIIGLSALLAAGATIKVNLVDVLLAKPAIAFRYDTKPVNVTQGEKIQLALVLINEKSVPADVRIDAWLEPVRPILKGDARRRSVITGSEGDIPEVSGGEKRDINIAGDSTTPGDYEIVIRATARAGILQPAQSFGTRSRVKIWPELPTPVSAQWTAASPTVAELRGAVEIGRAWGPGIDCSIAVKGKKSMIEESFSMTASTPASFSLPAYASTADGYLYRHFWSIPDTKARQTIGVRLLLAHDPLMDIKDIEKATDFTCGFKSVGAPK